MLKVTDPGRKLLHAGSHRTRTPQETLECVYPLRHEFGVTRLANVTGLDRIGIPVYLAIRPNSRSVAVSQGKGITPVSAKASALMEAVELWHAENMLRSMHFATFEEIGRLGTPIAMDGLPKVEGSRYSPQLRMHWVEGFDAVSREPLLIPHELVHADYTHPVHPGHGCFASSTNGLASGNHPLEALCHGICEVIERDALTVWHHLPAERQRDTAIDLTTVDSGGCAGLVEAFERAGLRIAAWDVSTDIGIASFLCVVADPADPGSHVGLGSGTHPDRTVALARALTEAAQTRMTYITGSRDDLMFDAFTEPGRLQMLAMANALFHRKGGLRDFGSVPTRINETLSEDIDFLAGRLATVGINQIGCVDLSREGIPVHVMRVVIPGLESPHDDDGFVPGPRALAVARGRP